MVSALLNVHPYPTFDHGITEEATQEVLSEFEGDTILLHQSSSKSDFNRNPYGDHDSYDDVIFDQKEGTEGRGILQEDDVEHLLEEYDKILFGGGELGGCHFEAYASIIHGESGDLFEEDYNPRTADVDAHNIPEWLEDDLDVEINFVPEITYGKQSYGEPFTLEDVALDTAEWGNLNMGWYDWSQVGLEPVVSENVKDIEILERYLSRNPGTPAGSTLAGWEDYRVREDSLFGSLVNRIRDSESIANGRLVHSR